MVLVFRHAPFEHLGLLEEILPEFEYVDLYLDPAAPLPATPTALVFMGGPMSANDDVPYLKRELEIICDAAARGIPMLGICLGAQLIAKALGARVYRNPVKEIGWYPIAWRPETATDPLLHNCAGETTVFQWHGETFDLPAGAVWLASSDACAHQAFRAGQGIYGFQFHLEVTPEMIADWVQQDANCGDVRELLQPIDPHAHAASLRAFCRAVFVPWAQSL